MPVPACVTLVTLVEMPPLTIMLPAPPKVRFWPAAVPLTSTVPMSPVVPMFRVEPEAALIWVLEPVAVVARLMNPSQVLFPPAFCSE